jgi:hypothetical protein
MKRKAHGSNPRGSQDHFEKQGIKVIDIYAVCGILELLSVPKKFKNPANGTKNFSNKQPGCYLD